MKIFFALIALLLYVGGFFGCTVARTSIQEIQIGIVFIIATLFAVGAALIEAIGDLRSTSADQPPPAPTDASSIDSAG